MCKATECTATDCAATECKANECTATGCTATECLKAERPTTKCLTTEYLTTECLTSDCPATECLTVECPATECLAKECPLKSDQVCRNFAFTCLQLTTHTRNGQNNGTTGQHRNINVFSVSTFRCPLVCLRCVVPVSVHCRLCLVTV